MLKQVVSIVAEGQEWYGQISWYVWVIKQQCFGYIKVCEGMWVGELRKVKVINKHMD